MARGREFQIVGAATAKLREPKHVQTRGTINMMPKTARHNVSSRRLPKKLNYHLFCCYNLWRLLFNRCYIKYVYSFIQCVPLLSPCSPMIYPWQFWGAIRSRSLIWKRKRDESSIVPLPITRWIGRPLNFHATYVIMSTETPNYFIHSLIIKPPMLNIDTIHQVSCVKYELKWNTTKLSE